MSVNGITNQTTAAAAYTTAAAKPADTAKEEAVESKTSSAAEESGVVYEPSSDAATTAKTTKYTPNTELINKLKADADQRTSQLKSLVEKLMLGQGNAIGTADDMWSFLRTGNVNVDAATRAQAQADIAEDGYWGVEQTSDRILDFAKALSGGDPAKIEEMRSAFEKGFKAAAKKWGGQLPDISQRTYEATMKKFDSWASENNKESTSVNATEE